MIDIAVPVGSIVNAALTASTADDQALYRAMLQGDDIITGDVADDAIEGFEGADELDGFDGDDTLTGGEWQRSPGGREGADVLNGGAGVFASYFFGS